MSNLGKLWLPWSVAFWLLWGPSYLVGQDDAVQPRILDEIVAKVNSEIITLTDLEEALSGLEADVAGRVSDPQERQRQFQIEKRELLKTLIRNKMMIQRADELGMSANIDVEVASHLERVRQDAGIPNMEVMEQVLQRQGSSMAEYRRTVREGMIIRNLLDQFVYSKITLLTPEVEAYYQEHQERFREPAEVELAEVLLLTEGKDRTAVRQNAQEVLQKLNDGQPFEELARQYSDGPTAQQGGGIGKFRENSMNEALEAVVFVMEVGQFSDIIETDYGFQIVKIISQTPAHAKPLEEVRPEIAQALCQEKAQPELDEFLKELIQESYIFIAPKYAAQYDVEEFIG